MDLIQINPKKINFGGKTQLTFPLHSFHQQKT